MLLGKPVIATNYSGNVDFMQNELAHPVEFELINLDSAEYQWVDVDDNAKWANSGNITAATQLHKTRELKVNAKAKNLIIPQFATESVASLMTAVLSS